MRLLQMHGVEVDLCPDCMGTWYDARELSRAVGLRFRDTASGAALAGARRTAHRCPSCAIPLYEREIDRGAGILVDQCPQCSGLFLDRGEFSRIQGHFRGRGAPARVKRATLASGRADAPGEVDGDSFGIAFFQWLTRLPVELDVPQTLFPPAVMTLVVLNAVVLVLALFYGLRDWIEALGLVPADVLAGRRLYTFLTSMFVHAGPFHLIGNMYFLYIAGDNVEEKFGPLRFLGFYLLCGVVADLAHVAGTAHSTLPSVGASGAVAGVLGAYLVLFPHVRFRKRWFYLLWENVTFDFPAYMYFGFWVAMQVVFALMGVPGVAWWAHVGGFTCGALIAACVRRRERARAA